MKKHSQQVKEKALEMFLSGVTLEEISLELKVNFETVKSWHRFGKWKQKNKETYRKTTEKLIKKVAKADAKDKFDVREEFKSVYKDIKEKDLPVCETAMEKMSARNQQRAYLREIGLIDQLYIENKNVKHSGQVEVKPILGGSININLPENQ
jgi:transposase-like protein